MKNLIILIISLLIICILSSSYCFAIKKVSLALIESPPLMSEKMEGKGVEAAIVKAAFQNVNIEIRYEFYPPARAFMYVSKGNMDGMVGWVWSKEREKMFYYTVPIFESPLVFFHLKNTTFRWKGYNDLQGEMIGIVLKNFYGPEFHDALRYGKFKVYKCGTDEQVFNLLKHKLIKAFPYNLISGYYIIQKKYDPAVAKMFTHHPKPLKKSVYHVLFSKAVKENKEITLLFNKGLKKLKKSGNYKKIINRYNLLN